MTNDVTPDHSLIQDPKFRVLLGVAVAGWLAAAAALAWQANLGSELSSSQASRAELEAEVAAANDAEVSLASLKRQIATSQTELSEIETERAAIADSLKDLRAETKSQEEALTRLADQSEGARLEASQFSTTLTETQTKLEEAEERLSGATAELAAVGARLEAARIDEATARQTIAALSQEASERSTQVADLEKRLQEVREAESGALLQLDELRRVEAAWDERRAGLEAIIVGLEARRATINDEIAAADAQRGVVQSQLTELTDALASRGADLAALENQFASAQDTTNGSEAVSQNLLHGTYVGTVSGFDPIIANFSPDGTFTLKRARPIGTSKSADVSGLYTLELDQIEFDKARGNLGEATFPMNCSVSITQEALEFPSDNKVGCMFGGWKFVLDAPSP